MGSWLKSCLRWKWKSLPPDQICICIWDQVRVGLGWGGCGPGAYAISVVRRWATIAALYLYSSSKAQREELGEWPWMERCGGGWLEPWEEDCNSEVNAHACEAGIRKGGRQDDWSHRSQEGMSWPVLRLVSWETGGHAELLSEGASNVCVECVTEYFSH